MLLIFYKRQGVPKCSAHCPEKEKMFLMAHFAHARCILQPLLLSRHARFENDDMSYSSSWRGKTGYGRGGPSSSSSSGGGYHGEPLRNDQLQTPYARHSSRDTADVERRDYASSYQEFPRSRGYMYTTSHTARPTSRQSDWRDDRDGSYRDRHDDRVRQQQHHCYPEYDARESPLLPLPRPQYYDAPHSYERPPLPEKRHSPPRNEQERGGRASFYARYARQLMQSGDYGNYDTAQQSSSPSTLSVMPPSPVVPRDNASSDVSHMTPPESTSIASSSKKRTLDEYIAMRRASLRKQIRADVLVRLDELKQKTAVSKVKFGVTFTNRPLRAAERFQLFDLFNKINRENEKDPKFTPLRCEWVASDVYERDYLLNEEYEKFYSMPVMHVTTSLVAQSEKEPAAQSTSSSSSSNGNELAVVDTTRSTSTSNNAHAAGTVVNAQVLSVYDKSLLLCKRAHASDAELNNKAKRIKGSTTTTAVKRRLVKRPTRDTLTITTTLTDSDSEDVKDVTRCDDKTLVLEHSSGSNGATDDEPNTLANFSTQSVNESIMKDVEVARDLGVEPHELQEDDIVDPDLLDIYSDYESE